MSCLGFWSRSALTCAAGGVVMSGRTIKLLLAAAALVAVMLPSGGADAQTREAMAMASLDLRYSDGIEAADKNQCIRFKNRLRELDSLSDTRNPQWRDFPQERLDLARHAKVLADRLRAVGCPKPVEVARTAIPWMQAIDDRVEAEQRARAVGVEVQAGAGGQVITLPKRLLLGTEVGGVQRLGLFTPDREATGASASGSIKFNLGAFLFLPSWVPTGFPFGIPTGSLTEQTFKISGFYAESKVDQNGLTLDPGAGATLLIPGPNGGASGFALGANPLNIVRGASYSAELQKSGGRVEFGQTFRAGSAGAAMFDQFDLFLATGYKHVSFDESFAGNIPGFARNFAYVSSADVDQFNVRLGAGVRRTITSANGIKISFGGSVEAGPDFSSASGSDRLSFTGFADSVRPLDRSQTDFGFGAGVFVGFELQGGMKVAVDGRYMRDNGLPVFVRDGTNPTTLDLKGGDAFIGTASVTVPFGAR